MSHLGSEIDLRIYFAGLAVFADRDNEVRVLLPDAREPKDLGKLGRAEPHYAVVQFDQQDVVGENRAFGEFTDRLGRAKGYWLLDKDLLRVGEEGMVETELSVHRSAANGNGEGRPNGQGNGHGLGELPTGKNANYIEWIAPLSGEGGKPPQLKPALLDPLASPLSATEPLAGTFQLERGEILPAAFAAELGGFVIGEFPGPRRQALASVVLYRVRVRAPSVRLRSTKFDGSTGESLELSPRGGSGRRVELWVLNRSWPGIADQVSPRPSEIGQPNPDYIYFNDFLDNPVDPRQLPRAADRRRGEISPVVEACRDPGMRRLYFPASGGETLNASPCSPAYTH